MPQFVHTLHFLTKSALNLIGLLGPAKRARRWIAKQQFRCYYNERDLYKVRIHGRKVIFSTEDRYSGQWFFPRYADQIHEPKTTELLVRLSQKARNIIDVGANLGWFTCIAASLSDGTVHAFEMDANNLRRLNANVALNELQNVRVNHVAVTHSEGHVSYWKGPQSAGVGYSFTRECQGEEEHIRVDATTLDSYTQDHCESVELIKVDVEGAEQQVLEGGQQVIREFCPHILLEVHPSRLASSNTSPRNVLSALPEAYKIYRVENFRWGGELGHQPIDRSTFAPDEPSMLYAEPSNTPLDDFPPPSPPRTALRVRVRLPDEHKGRNSEYGH